MKNVYFRLIILITGLFLMAQSCDNEGGLTVVGVMYHHWWTEARWSDNPSNHPYEPALGHYNNANPDVIRQHIAWAKQAGVNTFVLDFWITDRDQSWVTANTQAVLDICDQEGMDYFFLIDGWFDYLDAADPAYEIAWRINARAAPYFGRPGYVKQNGKPALFFWAAPQADCTLFDAVRAGVEGTVGPVFMTGQLAGCFDMRMIYNPYVSWCEENDYRCQLEHQNSIWSGWAQDLEPWAPTALPGYNDSEVRAGNPILALNEPYFRESIQAALQYNQHHPQGDKWLFVCSWSEWHEGSQIEPSNDFSDPEFLLKALREEVDDFRSGKP